MEIKYQIGVIPDTKLIIDLYRNAGLNRPIADEQRIEKMYINSNLILTAWDEEILVGISRALTDFAYCCYLSDLAVNSAYQKKGIGKKLIDITREQTGTSCNLLLLSAPAAVDFYLNIGFTKEENGYVIKRAK